jgi:hypothetical protein
VFVASGGDAATVTRGGTAVLTAVVTGATGTTVYTDPFSSDPSWILATNPVALTFDDHRDLAGIGANPVAATFTSDPPWAQATTPAAPAYDEHKDLAGVGANPTAGNFDQSDPT